MKTLSSQVVISRALSLTVASLGAAAAHADVVRTGSGATPSAIQSVVDQFRADAGNPNNGVAGGPFTTGRREINWDAPALDAFASPNFMPADFFNNNSKRGAHFSTPGSGLLVSQRNGTNAADPALRFGDINPAYNTQFAAFSAQRLFAASGSTIIDTSFFVPSSPTTPASINSFGAVFTDVDLDGSSSLQFFDINGQLVRTEFIPAFNGGLSFVGVTFDAPIRIGRVRLNVGNLAMGQNNFDGPNADVVALDDFFYSEPLAIPAPGASAMLIGSIFFASRRARRTV